MSLVRLLHLSDLHLAKCTFFQRRGPDWVRDYRNLSVFFHPAEYFLCVSLVRQLATEFGEFDAFVVTGDLADTGAREDLVVASVFLGLEDQANISQQLPSEPKIPTLARSLAPLVLMPGNHDRYQLTLSLPGGHVFDEVFEMYWRGGQGVQSFEAGELLRIVACDLSLSENDEQALMRYLGRGKAYPDRIRLLQDETARIRDEHPDVAVLWAIHFPPKFKFPDPVTEHFHRLVDDDLLVCAAQESSVSHILCGHTHIWDFYPLNSGSSSHIQCAGSALSPVKVGQRNYLHVIEIEVEQAKITKFSQQGIVYDDERGRFVLEVSS